MSEFLRTFLIQVIGILNTLLYIYMWVIIIAALISWVNPDPYNPIVRFLYSVTDPVLKRIRRVIGISMGIDFSPMIAILGILLLQAFLKSLARALL
jgi:YggT family protein